MTAQERMDTIKRLKKIIDTGQFSRDENSHLCLMQVRRWNNDLKK